MPKLVRQSVTLPAPAETLYAMYLDPRAHSAFTGSKVVVSARRGTRPWSRSPTYSLRNSTPQPLDA